MSIMDHKQGEKELLHFIMLYNNIDCVNITLFVLIVNYFPLKKLIIFIVCMHVDVYIIIFSLIVVKIC